MALSRYNGGLSGLVNMGNTCYMNASIQCLSHTQELVQYFLSNAFLEDINENSKNTEQEFVYNFVKLIRAIWEDNCRIEPRSFKVSIGKINELFIGYGQQDSHECIVFILNALHESLKYPVNMNMRTQGYISQERMDLEKQAFDTLNQHYKKGYSMIVDLFYGQFHTKIVCENCNKTSNNFDPFCFLSLSLPLRKTSTTLEECIQEYMETNMVSYRCEKCKVETNDSKRSTQLWTAPKVLIIQLKRFRGNRKIEMPVEIPVGGLNLSKCITPERGYGSRDRIYDLYAVSCHSGTLAGGHYWAFAKHNGAWYNFNDASVSPIGIPDVRTKGYVLFYELKN